MKTEVRILWTQALRSGEFPQGLEVLRSADEKYCCLGVLCELAVRAGIIPPATGPGLSINSLSINSPYHYDGRVFSLPDAVADWAGLTDPDGLLPVPVPHKDSVYRDLSELNDSEEFSFAEIADIIDAQFSEAGDAQE